MRALTALAACMATAILQGALTDRCGEAQVVTLVQEAAVIEVWAAPESETWTIILTKPSGESCIVATGAGVIPARPTPAGDPP